MSQPRKCSVCQLRKMKREGRKIVMLTAYDAPTAKLAEECGADLILVGDSLGMAVLGYQNTIPVTVEQSLHHCAAVRRGVTNSFVVGDMPFMSYQASVEQALLNAARYMQESLVDGVKLEGGVSMAPTVERMVRAGVPVMGHIGLLPQNVKTAGGYRVYGRTEEEAAKLMDDAKALESAGAFAIVIECVPAELAGKISQALSIPAIGIGAGPLCDGQVQVVNDILGLFTEFQPKHSKRYVDLTSLIRKAFEEYADDVRNSRFPGPENSF